MAISRGCDWSEFLPGWLVVFFCGEDYGFGMVVSNFVLPAEGTHRARLTLVSME